MDPAKQLRRIQSGEREKIQRGLNRSPYFSSKMIETAVLLSDRRRAIDPGGDEPFNFNDSEAVYRT